MSRFKHQMGMAKLRVRGMANVTYTAMLHAVGPNIHRVAAYRATPGVVWKGCDAFAGRSPRGALTRGLRTYQPQLQFSARIQRRT
jgi:hypothetical protein